MRKAWLPVSILALLMGLAEAASLPESAPDLCRLGDRLFRESRFEAAEDIWLTALTDGDTAARAHLGLARLDRLRFRRRSARDHVAAAYRLAPRDPGIVLAYTAYVPNPQARRVLLQNVLALARDEATRNEAAARLSLEDRLGGRRLTLASPYSAYRLRLEGFHPAGAWPAGLVLKARINGGKPLRLVFDTGADGILLNAAAARNLELESLELGAIGGAGGSPIAQARLALARRVEIDELQLENCPIRIATAAPIAPGADGVIGANLLQAFELRLDAANRTLDLNPFAEAPGDSPDPWATYDAPDARVRQLGHLLLLRASVDGRAEGYFLLDTGAAYTSISSTLVAGGAGRTVALRGAAGPLPGAFRIEPVMLDIDGQWHIETQPVTFDLGAVSRQEGAEISGLLGYSLLSRSVVTINYRDGVVRLAQH